MEPDRGPAEIGAVCSIMSHVFAQTKREETRGGRGGRSSWLLQMCPFSVGTFCVFAMLRYHRDRLGFNRFHVTLKRKKTSRSYVVPCKSDKRTHKKKFLFCKVDESREEELDGGETEAEGQNEALCSCCGSAGTRPLSSQLAQESLR